MAKRIRLLLTSLVCVIVAATIGFAACASDDENESVTYTVTYERGADDATGDIPESQTYEEGDTVTLASSTTFTREGYVFTAWSDGESTYAAGASYTMPAHDVTFTALWEEVASSGSDDGEEDGELTTSELDEKFYDASNWEYMTNDDGAELDTGDIAYSLSDGSIKFHRANQAIDYGDQTNAHMSFMLNGTNDWNIWFNSSSLDNDNNYSYRLQYAYSGLRISISSNPEAAAAYITDTTYKKAEWNRFDIIFSTEDGVTSIKVYVNGELATLTAGDNTQNVKVEDNVLYHTMPGQFKTGNYIVVKVWDADDYIQLKPVANANVEDVPIIAAIGASITQGAGADNSYTESFPAQLQNMLNGDYNVINFGKSGRTVRTDLTDDSDSDPIPWLYNLQAEGVKAIVPDIAIINMGTNDSKTSNDPATTYENFYEAYSYLVDWLLEINPDMRIIVCTVPYAYSSIYNISNENIRDIIAPVQRQIVEDYCAKGYNFELVDLYEITQNKSLLFTDGVHPGTLGYTMIAEVLEQVILYGEDSLTEEFLADINERYDDPYYEISDISAELEVVDNQVMLTVSGNIVYDEDADFDLRLVLETGTDGDERETAITTDENGDFSVSVRIDDLTGTSWYNVRIYLNDNYYYFVRLAETEYSSGDIFYTSSRSVTVRTWSSGDIPTFSFSVSDYNGYAIELESVEIDTTDGVVLKISGTVSNTDDIQLYVGVHPTTEGKWRDFADITVNADGTFTVEYDLASIPVDEVDGWVNVRIYYDDGTYFVVPLASTTSGGSPVSSGDVFYGDGIKLTVQSWTDGNVGTLSFSVASYTSYVTLDTVEIDTSDDGATLIISGTAVDVEDIQLYVGVHPTNEGVWRDYIDITINPDGTFTVEYDLASIPVDEVGSEWINVRIYYSDGTYLVVPLASTTSGGSAVSSGDVFYADGIKITVRTWTDSGVGTLSFSVEAAEDDDEEATASVQVTSVFFEDGYLVVTGTVEDVTGLSVALANGDDDIVSVEADITEGAFSIKIDLSLLTASAGEWYRLKVSADGGDWENVPYYDGFDTDQFYMYGTRRYYFTEEWSNTDFALVYASYDYSITNVEITDVDGTATLIVEGYLADDSISAEDIVLWLDDNSNNPITVTNELSVAGTFKFTYDISGLEEGTPYYLRLYNGSAKIADINSMWAADILFEEVTIGEDTVYYFYRNSLTAYNTLGVMREDTSAVVSVTSVFFEDGYLVVTGTVENVDTLYVYLINTNVSDSLDNYVIAEVSEGVFTAKLSLDTIASFGQGSSIPFNLRYKIDDLSSSTINVEQGVIDITQVYEYNGYLYKLGTNSSCVALYCSEATAQVIATYVGFEDDCLVVNGTVVGTDNVVLYVQNTVTSTYFQYEVGAITVADDGTFEIRISLDVFEEAVAGAYLNLRVSIDGSETLTGVTRNNTDLSQTYTYGDREYSLGLNGTTVYVMYTAVTALVS